MKKNQVVRSIKKNPSVRALNKKANAIGRSTKKSIKRLKRSIPLKNQKKSNTPPIIAAVLVLAVGIIAVGAYLAKALLGPIVIEDDYFDYE